MPTPLLAGLGPTELLIILVVLVLLFGASKLPELARGSGRALRIFKAETKGLLDDEDEGKDNDKRRDGQQQLGERTVDDRPIDDRSTDPERRQQGTTRDDDR